MNLYQVAAYAAALSALLAAPLAAFANEPFVDASDLGIPHEEARSAHTVILLNGMGRGRASLWVLDMRLKHVGYNTVNFPFVAHSQSIDDMSIHLIEFIKENVKTDTYHLIAHSLGNLIVRTGFKYGYPPGLGRIVMLAPPNHPAELARALRDNPVYKWFTGKSGQQLASDAFYLQLPIPKVEFGIIAGDRGKAVMLSEPNDGVVTVASTKLEGMTDWVVVPQAHTFIMNSRDVAALCVAFLETGRFVLPGAARSPQDEAPAPETEKKNAALDQGEAAGRE